MTIKNFFKTAVLGIAFCSVFGMSSSIAMDNNSQLNINKDNSIEVYKQQLRKIFHQLPEYNTEERDIRFDLSIRGKSNAAPKEEYELVDKITHVINQALYETLDITDLDILKDSIMKLKQYRLNSTIYSRTVIALSAKIINAVSKIYYSTPHLT